MSIDATAEQLALCASEPIRVPGAIQPHGWLASLDAGSRALTAFSENWTQLVGDHEAASLPGRISRALAKLHIDPHELERNDGSVSLGYLRIGEHRLHVIAHKLGGRINIELEIQAPLDESRAPIYSLTRRLLPRMQAAQTVDELCALAALEMKRLTGFGRCLVYRFDADGHGEVLAEQLDAGYDSYAQHRFPASDIPAQARALYRVNRFRLIPDAHYAPVPVRFVDGPHAPEHFDMSLVQIRSISPVHLEYMRNMGTLASSSVSIMVRGELWGLASCHDQAAHHLDYPTRMACEHLGQLLSLQIEAKEDNERVSEQAALRRITLSMVAHLADSDATLQRLVDDPVPLLRMVRAGGAAVLLDGRCWTAGTVPGEEALRQLGEWLSSRGDEEFHTERASAQCPPLAAHAAVASGVIAVSISQVHRHHIVWFRPEVVQSVKWAGDPRSKPADPRGGGRLHPRLSFGTWREELRGRSLPWSAGEVGAALELRQALMAIVLRRAEEMAEVAGELGRVNKELESFSYTVSHDLRAPMRHIAGYVDLVLDGEPALGERSRRYLAHVKSASAYAGQLVDALLDFSRMGRSALRRTTVDITPLLQELVREVDEQSPKRVSWQVDGAFPKFWADPILLQVAVRNLVGNAVKYSRDRPEPRIEIRAVSTPQGDGIEVRDNGVGFEMKYVDKLFGVFQRLHAAEAFEGTGIGLASVRRVVERHGGSVHAQGEPGRGATFTFTLPRREDAPALPRRDTLPPEPDAAPC